MGAQGAQIAWHSTLAEVSPLELVAGKGAPSVELWRLDASPVWHTKAVGLPPVHGHAPVDHLVGDLPAALVALALAELR